MSLGLALLLFGRPPAASARPDLQQVVDSIQKQYEMMQDLEADFLQESYNKTLQKKQRASGKLYMKKPGRMRWDYQAPEKQIIVADGRFFWWYTPRTGQVVRQKADQAMSSNLAITFMGGMGEMQKDFKIRFAEPAGGTREDTFTLKLVPARPQASIAHLLLTVDARQYRTRRIVLQDFYGNTTSIEFSGLKINQGLAQDLFNFTPGPGVQVITPEDFPGGGLH